MYNKNIEEELKVIRIMVDSRIIQYNYSYNLKYNGNMLRKLILGSYIYREWLIWLRYWKKKGMINIKLGIFCSLWGPWSFRILLGDFYILF